MFDIKVKAINTIILEWTREGAVELGVMRAKRIPQEIRKPEGDRIVHNGQIGRVTADGEHDRLSHLLADRDIFPDLVTALEKFRAFVDSAITLVAEVGARPCANGIWEDIDETDIDDVHRGLLTEVAQTRLVGSLALDGQSA